MRRCHQRYTFVYTSIPQCVGKHNNIAPPPPKLWWLLACTGYRRKHCVAEHKVGHNVIVLRCECRMRASACVHACVRYKTNIEKHGTAFRITYLANYTFGLYYSKFYFNYMVWNYHHFNPITFPGLLDLFLGGDMQAAFVEL